MAINDENVSIGTVLTDEDREILEKLKEAQDTPEELPQIDEEGETESTELEIVLSREEFDVKESEVIQAELERTLEQEDAIVPAQSVRKGNFKSASASERRENYVSNYIFPIDDRPKFETEGEKKRKISVEVANACLSYREERRAGKILTGTIFSVSKIYIDNEPHLICNVAYKGEILIRIPFEKLTRLTPSKRVSKAQMLQEMEKYAHERCGSEVDFFVTEYDESIMQGGGSRIDAMDRIRQLNYMVKNTRYNRYRLNEGDLAEARICYVTRTHMCIEVFGVERVLTASDIEYSRIRDLQTKYHAGERISVKITRLRRENNELDVEFSAKEAKPNPKQYYIDKFSEGDTCRGEITYIDTGAYFVRIIGTDMDILCQQPRELSPSVGQEVMVRVSLIDKQRLRLFGQIRKIIV